MNGYEIKIDMLREYVDNLKFCDTYDFEIVIDTIVDIQKELAEYRHDITHAYYEIGWEDIK